jgi:hypothetical protein
VDADLEKSRPFALLEYRVTLLEQSVRVNTRLTITVLVTLLGALAWFILSHVKVV